MKLLISGAGGQLGQDLQKILSEQHECRAYDRASLDISDAQAVSLALRSHPIEAWINCAAFTRVDAAETEREAAWRANVEGPRILARHCELSKIPLFHVSTDYVFNGERVVPQPYLESDATDPQSYYGKSKLAGEQAIAEETERYAIIRTAWLYGIGGPNFLKTMLSVALQGKPLKVVNDQFGALTWTRRLAEQIRLLVERQASGLYHASAEGYATWYEGAKLFLEEMGVKFSLSPCTTEDYPTPARRPKNSILENQRLKEQGLNLMVDWKQDVVEFVKVHREALIREARGK